ncbi:SRPBCC family protein [Nocardioides aequoreus]|uniref:SRPBCC family protein n=1 Tax=Nocardioides aequoreus TaxID=397278 RepID=UPI0004C332C8|nr:SRPBCC family protein [Nocardioides aequoreus]
MAAVTLSTRGAAPPDIAWERYADPAAWAGWAPQIQRVETDAARIAAGVHGTVHAGLLRRPTLPVRFRVDAVDEDARTWAWQVRLGAGPARVTLRLEHGVTEEAGGSGTWLRVRGPLPVVAAYAPLARLALGRLVAP